MMHLNSRGAYLRSLQCICTNFRKFMPFIIEKTVKTSKVSAYVVQLLAKCNKLNSTHHFNGGNFMKNYLMALLLMTCILAAFSGCGSDEVQATDSSSTGSELTSNSDASTELTVATPMNDAFLIEAAQRFEAKYDGRYTVTIVVYDEPMRYSQMLSTAILGGRGEDVITASWLAWQRLADTGRLLDLNGMVDFPAGVFYQNIMDAYIYNGGRYVVPMMFSVDNVFAFNGTATADTSSRFSLDDVVAIAEGNPGIPLIVSPMGMCGVTLSYRFFELYFNDFIDLSNRRANVDTAQFRDLLNSVQSISDSLRWPQPGEDWLITGEMFHNIIMATGGLVDYRDYHLMTNSRGEGLAAARGLVAINANTQNPELAARFIAFLLSEEVQSSPEIFATPINRNAAVTRSMEMLEAVRLEGFKPDWFDFDSNHAAFDAIVARLTIAGTSDPFIGNFVREELTRFFNGEVTAEQASSNLQARLTTYLNE